MPAPLCCCAQVPSPFKPSVNALDSSRPVRGWSDKDKAKLSTILVTPSDQVCALAQAARGMHPDRRTPPAPCAPFF